MLSVCDGIELIGAESCVNNYYGVVESLSDQIKLVMFLQDATSSSDR